MFSEPSDLDLEAMIKHVKANPMLAKALATSITKWEAELLDVNIADEFNTPDPKKEVQPDMCPATPHPPEPPPVSLLSEIARPLSPTDICDFPYFDFDQTDTPFKLHPTTTTTLPKFQISRVDLNQHMLSIKQKQESIDDWDDEEVRVSELTSYSVIADIGTY
jgi:hypothetical protein